MATKNGVIKRTELSEFTNLRKSGLIALVLREDDELIGVALTDGSYELLLGTRDGMAIRFPETDMRPIGRAAMGVKSIELNPGDEVVDMCPVFEGMKVLSITENGYGKLTEIDEYRVQSRGGKGIKAMNLTDKTGRLTCLLLADEAEDILLITDDGTIIRVPHSRARGKHLHAGPQHPGRAPDARGRGEQGGLRGKGRGRGGAGGGARGRREPRECA